MNGATILHETGPSAFLVAGLEIEELQYVFIELLQAYANVII